jgi:hypothetical protein
MFGSSVLEVAIGVIFVYLVLSLICTAVNEAIATVINKRGKNLFGGIKNLLNDPAFTGLAQQVYNHGLVDGVSQDAAVSTKPTRLPSYLPSETFSLALLDVLSANGVVSAAHGTALTAAEKAYDDYETARRAAGVKPDVEDQNLPANVQNAKAVADQARTALVNAATNAKAAYDQAVETGGAAPSDAQKQVIAQAKTASDTASAAVKILDAHRAAVASACNPKDAELIKKAADTLEQALVMGRKLATGIPNQLDNVQAAVNRLPEGHTKESLLVLIDKTKLEVAAGANAVVHFRKNIEGWFDDAMDRVGGWYKRWTQRIQLVLAIILVLLLNVDTIMLVKRFSTDKEVRAAILAQAEKANQNGAQPNPEQLQADIRSVSLPLGWTNDPKDEARYFPWCVGGWLAFWRTLLKLLGLLISIGAVSLGAPFWFDALSKFINLRGAGTPPGEKKKSAAVTA